MCLNQQRACQITTKVKVQYSSPIERPAAKHSILEKPRLYKALPPLSHGAWSTLQHKFLDIITALTTCRTTPTIVSILVLGQSGNNRALEGTFRCGTKGSAITQHGHTVNKQYRLYSSNTKKEHDREDDHLIAYDTCTYATRMAARHRGALLVAAHGI